NKGQQTHGRSSGNRACSITPRAAVPKDRPAPVCSGIGEPQERGRVCRGMAGPLNVADSSPYRPHPAALETSMLFARLILAVQAIVMLGLGLAYWLYPYEMANLNGMLLMEPTSVSNTRVYYGGLQVGLALFLAWSMWRPER